MDTNLSEERPGRRGLRYRHHPVAFKRAVVEQSQHPGVSVSRLAREHGINANQVFAWRKAYQEGRLGTPTFLPVAVTALTDTNAEITAPVSGPSVGCIVLERRGARLTIEGEKGQAQFLKSNTNEPGLFSTLRNSQSSDSPGRETGVTRDVGMHGLTPNAVEMKGTGPPFRHFPFQGHSSKSQVRLDSRKRLTTLNKPFHHE